VKKRNTVCEMKKDRKIDSKEDIQSGTQADFNRLGDGKKDHRESNVPVTRL